MSQKAIAEAEQILAEYDRRGLSDSAAAKALANKVGFAKRRELYIANRVELGDKISADDARAEYTRQTDAGMADFSFNQAVTRGIAPFIDELGANVTGAVATAGRAILGGDADFSDSRNKALALARTQRDWQRDASPVATTATEMAGSVVGAGYTGAALGAAGLLPKAATTVPGLAAQGAVAGGLGAAAYEFQDTDGGLRNRADAALGAAPYGAAFGGVLGAGVAAAPRVIDYFKSAPQRARRKGLRMVGADLERQGVDLGAEAPAPPGLDEAGDVRFSAEGPMDPILPEPNPADAARGVVAGAVDPNSLAGMEGRNGALVLADAVPDLAGSVYRLSNRMKTTLRDFFTERGSFAQRSQRMLDSMGDAIGVSNTDRKSLIKGTEAYRGQLEQEISDKAGRGYRRLLGARISDEPIPRSAEMAAADLPQGWTYAQEAETLMAQGKKLGLARDAELDPVARFGREFDPRVIPQDDGNFSNLTKAQKKAYLRYRGFGTSKYHDGFTVDEAAEMGLTGRAYKAGEMDALLKRIRADEGPEGLSGSPLDNMVPRLRAMRRAADGKISVAETQGDKTRVSALTAYRQRITDLLSDGVRDGSGNRVSFVGDRYHEALRNALTALETSSGVKLTTGAKGADLFSRAPEEILRFVADLRAKRARISSQLTGDFRDNVLKEFDRAFDAYRRGAVRAFMRFLEPNVVRKNARVFNEQHEDLATKLRTLFPEGDVGDDLFERYLRTVEDEGLAQFTERKVLYGSETAERVAMDAATRDAAQQGLDTPVDPNAGASFVDVLRYASPREAAKEIGLRIMRGALDRYSVGMTQRVADAIAEDLLRSDFAQLAREIADARSTGRAVDLARSTEAMRRKIDEFFTSDDIRASAEGPRATPQDAPPEFRGTAVADRRGRPRPVYAASGGDPAGGMIFLDTPLPGVGDPPSYVNIRRPLVIDAQGADYQRPIDGVILPYKTRGAPNQQAIGDPIDREQVQYWAGHFRRSELFEIVEEAKKVGYDGIIIKNATSRGGEASPVMDMPEAANSNATRALYRNAYQGDVYVAFEGAQIHSTRKFSGAPADGDIRASAEGPTRQTSTPEFKRWFGKSKIVDEQGQPLILYHGTPATFNSFDPDKIRQQGAFFFSDDPDVAWAYTSQARRDERPQILPVFLRIENPYVHDFRGQSYYKVGSNFLAELVETAKRNGHDGAIFRNIGDENNALPGAQLSVQDQYVVWDPKAIKSASGNRGTFDPEDPDIRFAAEKPPRQMSVDELAARDPSFRKLLEEWEAQQPASPTKSPPYPPRAVVSAADQQEAEGLRSFPGLRRGGNPRAVTTLGARDVGIIRDTERARGRIETAQERALRLARGQELRGLRRRPATGEEAPAPGPAANPNADAVQQALGDVADVKSYTRREMEEFTQARIADGSLPEGTTLKAWMRVRSDDQGRVVINIGPDATLRDAYEEIAHGANALGVWTKGQQRMLLGMAEKWRKAQKVDPLASLPPEHKNNPGIVRDETIAKFLATYAENSKLPRKVREKMFAAQAYDVALAGKAPDWVNRMIYENEAETVAGMASELYRGNFRQRLLEKAAPAMEALKNASPDQVQRELDKIYRMRDTGLKKKLQRVINGSGKFSRVTADFAARTIVRLIRQRKFIDAEKQWRSLVGSSHPLWSLGAILVLLAATENNDL